MGFPGLEVDIPYGLSIGILDAQTCVPDLFFITHLTRVRVDVVQAKVPDWCLLVWCSIFRQVQCFPIVLPSNHLRTITMMEVEVDNCSMCKTMVDRSMSDANMDIIDPAKSGWIVRRAVVAWRSDAYEGSPSMF